MADSRGGSSSANGGCTVLLGHHTIPPPHSLLYAIQSSSLIANTSINFVNNYHCVPWMPYHNSLLNLGYKFHNEMWYTVQPEILAGIKFGGWALNHHYKKFWRI